MKVSWDSEGEAHIASRSARYGGAHNLEVGWVDEAAADPLALMEDPDPRSAPDVVRITGASENAGYAITLIAERREDGLWGLTAWKTPGRQLREYEEARDADEEG